MNAVHPQRRDCARLGPLLLALLGAGAVAWAWHAVAGVARELRQFNGFDGMHLEAVAPPQRHMREDRSWPIPG